MLQKQRFGPDGFFPVKSTAIRLHRDVDVDQASVSEVWN
jgi:hypothetical protein